MVIEMCGPLENGAEGPRGVGDTLKLFACFAPSPASQESPWQMLSLAAWPRA